MSLFREVFPEGRWPEAVLAEIEELERRFFVEESFPSFPSGRPLEGRASQDYDPPRTGAPARPGVPVCCQDPANLDRIRLAADAIMDTCRICGRRHFRIRAEPGSLGVKR